MSYRGLDFGQGLSRYADLMRAAYQDRQRQAQLEMQSNMAQQQSAALYGFQGPGVQNVDNPFFEQGAMPQPPPPIQEELPPQYQPGSGEPMIAPPAQGEPYIPQRPGMDRRPFSVEDTERNPAQEQVPGYVQYTQGVMKHNLSAMQDQELARTEQKRLLEEAKSKKESGAPVSFVDNLIKKYASSETIHPFVLRQLLELKEKEIAARGRGDNDPLALAIKALGAGRDIVPIPSSGSRAQPRAAAITPQEKIIMDELKALNTIQGMVGVMQTRGLTKAQLPAYIQQRQAELQSLQERRLGGGKSQASPLVNEDTVKALAAKIKKLNPKLSDEEALSKARQTLGNKR